jgi:hypothetical protein
LEEIESLEGYKWLTWKAMRNKPCRIYKGIIQILIDGAKKFTKIEILFWNTFLKLGNARLKGTGLEGRGHSALP